MNECVNIEVYVAGFMHKMKGRFVGIGRKLSVFYKMPTLEWEKNVI